MKFHESHFDDYCASVDEENFHSELKEQIDSFPKSIENFGNTIIYGPPASGKYSQMLYLVRRYSPSALKYEKKVSFVNEKQTYIYRISDIHYEVDMSLLGCYSKVLWHEIFQQIVDIVSIKVIKQGIIVCKNFHCVHNELLDIFYSYMQQYSSGVNHIKLSYIFLTEHLSFIPENILNSSQILCVKRPIMKNLERLNKDDKKIIEAVNQENLQNMKEIYSFKHLNSVSEIPTENFNTICDNIIKEMKYHKKMLCSQENSKDIDIKMFRDQIYDILIYNLDALDCVWHILSHFIKEKYFKEKELEIVMRNISLFITRYGNNYRAIFHIESIIFSMICNFT
jgi:hypothetical protein